MKLQLAKGSTSQIITVFIQDSSSTTGAGLGSLDHTSNIVGGYVRTGGTGVALAVDEDVATEGTYQAPSAAGKVRIGTPANMRTGTYELHLHNDLLAAGANSILITLGGATNMADLVIEIQLTTLDMNTVMRGTDSASTHNAAAVKTAVEADGSKLDHLWEMTEDDGGVRRLTTNALEQGPDTTAGLSLHGDYDAAKTAAQAGNEMDLVNAPNATAVTAIQSGLGTAAAQATIAGYIDTEIGTIITAVGTTLVNHLLDIKGTGFAKDTHSLPQCLTATDVDTVTNLTNAPRESVHTWYVDGTNGNDNYAGTSWAAAEATIPAAIADASNGDVIRVAPGTYNGQVDLTGKTGVLLKADSAYSTIITHDAITLLLGHGCGVRGFTVTTTAANDSNQGKAIDTSGYDNCWIDWCIVNGKYDGIFATSSDNLRVTNSIVNATWDSVALAGCNNFLLRDCYLYSDGSFDTGTDHARAVLVAGSAERGRIERCVLNVLRNPGLNGDTVGLSVDDAYVLVSNCLIQSQALHPSFAGVVYGVDATGTGDVRLDSCTILTTNGASGGTIYDLRQAETARLTISGLAYDTSKTNGTITYAEPGASILVDTGTDGVVLKAAGLAADAANEIADAVLSRNVSNVEATAPEHSLCTIVLAGLESSLSGTTWTIKRTDGSTTHATKTVTADGSASPITGVS